MTEACAKAGRWRAEPAEQYLPELVSRWDELIDWGRRTAGERGFFVEALRRRGVRSVLDAAAGTGFHSVTLAAAGFDVTAVDASAAMLKQTASNARWHGQHVTIEQADWRGLGAAVPGRFDAIVCLGSSFPHLFTEADRRHVLREFRDKLEPGGTLIVDHRNFDAILAGKYRGSGEYYYCGAGVTVSVEHAGETLCRFRYDFPGQETHRLEVYPIRQGELRSLLRATGFTSVRTYGDFAAEFHPTAPDFIIHVAETSPP